LCAQLEHRKKNVRFLQREIQSNRVGWWPSRVEGVDTIAITSQDLAAVKELLPSVLEDASVAAKLQPVRNHVGHRLLAYFIPIDYVMQGMIADTGPEWKLFEHRWYDFGRLASPGICVAVFIWLL
jgi:hypothetical protein